MPSYSGIWTLQAQMQNVAAGNWTAAPVNTVAPVISGTVAVGQTLSSTTGTWTGNPAPTTFAYQWQRGTSNISGATSSTYTVQAADVGSTLRCSVTATSTSGATSANSANTIIVPPEQQLWSLGANSIGQLGLNDTADRSSPVQIGSMTNWSKISAGQELSVAIKNDNTLWAWGRNTGVGADGQLGQNDTINRSSPVQIGALTTWYEAAAGNNHCAAIRNDGTLWAWGSNAGGQLGIGNTAARSSPVQVGALTTWSQISCGSGWTLALKTDGTLWSWGGNSYGQLGLGDTNSRSSPVQIGASTDWYKIGNGAYHCLVIKSDGSLWAWGEGGFGRLGTGNTSNINSPVQIGALTTWTHTSGGLQHSFALKNDNSMWGWGRNTSGQLGQNNVTDRSSPVQVGGLTTWSQISCGNQWTTALKNDGALWSWGSNGNGQLGQGNTTSISSPVQVGALTTWSTIPKTGAANDFFLALKTT